MRKTTFSSILICFGLIVFVISCKYDEVLPVEPDPGVQISFNNDIIPIFNSSCNLSSCHNGSGPSPDLRPGTAYDALWNGSYIDTLVPENSELYLWLSGARGIPMPVEGVNAGYVSTVLQWIDQGALDN
ncbi:MAG TPA: hypothetical protein VI603_05595 [Saprospiraceae bacterium]|nr:hypothetical protein [Saprospiraceae bacterium]